MENKKSTKAIIASSIFFLILATGVGLYLRKGESLFQENDQISDLDKSLQVDVNSRSFKEKLATLLNVQDWTYVGFVDWTTPEHVLLAQAADLRGAEGDSIFYLVNLDTNFVSKLEGVQYHTLPDIKVDRDAKRIAQIGQDYDNHHVSTIVFYDLQGKELNKFEFADVFTRLHQNSSLSIVSSHEIIYIRYSVYPKTTGDVILFDSKTRMEKALYHIPYDNINLWNYSLSLSKDKKTWTLQGPDQDMVGNL